ncbi:hypothetical protein Dimus_014994 [Dionaea muscipula]
MRKVERSRASGTNIEDVIGVAKQFYFQTEGHNFKWKGCWRILKDSSKWFDYTREQEEKKPRRLHKGREAPMKLEQPPPSHLYRRLPIQLILTKMIHHLIKDRKSYPVTTKLIP